MKPLIVVPSPRNLTEVERVINTLPDDKLWCKYYKPEILAYNIIQEQFMDSDYTHIVIIPDDLLVNLKDYLILKQDMKYYPDDVISGYCNVDTTQFKDYANITFDPVSPQRANRTYNWVPLADADNRNDIIEVGYAGFGMFAVPKSLFKAGIRFRNDSFNGQNWDGCCVDVMFCYDVYQKNRRVLCDLRLRSQHLKISDNQYHQFRAGIDPPKFYYQYMSM